MAIVPPHISVVSPVYKAEGCLHELYTRLRDSLETITPNFEIILVEDCGGDRSWEIIQELASQDHRVKGIQFSRNFGQQYGITAGLDYCTGDWVIVMDCDLQDPPEEISRFYAKAQEGYDIVISKRNNRQHALHKRFTSWLFYQVLNYFADLNYDYRIGNFRIMSRNVVNNFCKMREQLRFFGGLVHWMGFSIASIDIQHGVRVDGKGSTYTFRKLWNLAIDTIIAYSDKPLRLSVKVGFLISSIAFLGGIYLLVEALRHGFAVAGWGSLIISLYFLGGIIIANLGIIGIYLGKSFDEAKRRPLYIIRNSTFDPAESLLFKSNPHGEAVVTLDQRSSKIQELI